MPEEVLKPESAQARPKRV